MNSLRPSERLENRALVYRQKTFNLYSKELQNVTSDNYETILVTGTFLLALVPAPESDAEDSEHLEWMNSLLKLSEGLRILVSLRWAQGIEKLSVYPLICRELRTLPPPPLLIIADKPPIQTRAGPLGTTPDHPNPASTYGLPYAMPFAGFVFLPPPLMSLLDSIIRPPDGSLDFDTHTLVPVFYVFVFTSFLMPEFLALVKAREPRALVLVTWFFALARLVPKGWWADTRMVNIVRALARAIRQRGDIRSIAALAGAERLVELVESEGKEKAAESVFEGWEGVTWADGPEKAAEWEAGLLLDMGDDIGFGELDIDFNVPA
jgi:hypothetical protein